MLLKIQDMVHAILDENSSTDWQVKTLLPCQIRKNLALDGREAQQAATRRTIKWGEISKFTPPPFTLESACETSLTGML